MDSPALPAQTHALVLRDLGRVNRWTLTARPILDWLGKALGAHSSFSLLDVGYGGGDVLRAIARWADRRGVEARLVGVDLDPRCEKVARAAGDAPIDYRTGDYRDQEDRFDFIISSQVAHHLTDPQLFAFLRHMEDHAALGWLVCDLHRHGLAWWGYPLLARLLNTHRIVREDGQLSIARSLTPGEWATMLATAGLDPQQVRIRRRFPFRLTVERVRRGARPDRPGSREPGR